MVECNSKKVVTEWKNKFQDVEDLGNTIPKFTLFVGNKNWGQINNRIKATVIIIKAAAKDTPYLKTLLSVAYKQEKIKSGMFVPLGLFWIVAEETYKHQLCAHNEYIQATTAIAIVGLHLLTMIEAIQNNGDSMTLEHHLNEVNPAIKLIQETNRTDKEGQWLIICTKTNAPR
eukprot:698042-Ditylum_brightwellii.AAC.1